MNPLKPKSSSFLRAVQMRRIGQAFRQTWKPFRLRHAKVYAMFKYDRAYNQWLLDRMISDARRKRRCLSPQGSGAE
jgi:hypothetical protein